MPCPNWITALEQVKAAGLAGVVLSFNTGDRVFAERAGQSTVASLKYFLASKYCADGFSVGYFSLASGMTDLAPPGAPSGRSSPFARLQGTENPVHAFRAAESVLKDSRARSILVVDYAEHIAAATPHGASNDALAVLETLHAWSTDDDIRRSGNFIVLICREGALHPLLRHGSGFREITIDLPDTESRRAFTEFLLAARERGLQQRLGVLEATFPVSDFASASGGMRLIDIENLLLDAAARGQPVNRDAVRTRKRHAISQLCHDVLEVIEPTEGFESVAGCRAAKGYFSRAIAPLWRKGHGSLPQGVLLAGVPGSGKSFLIKALAKELSAPCLVLRGVRSPWVGESERNLDRVLQVATQLAPCLLWTDELDQQGMGERASGPQGDSGVNQRMLGRLLEFFGDSSVRGRILWVATTNRPDLLDIAIRDRFSIKIPFLHPSAQERSELLPMLAKQVGRGLAPGVDCARFTQGDGLEMLSVRSLQEIVVWAGTLADIDGQAPGALIDNAHLDLALADYKPGFDPIEQELIALNSLRMTSFNSLLPWVGFEGFDRARAEFPGYVAEMIDRDSGRLDPLKLERRIVQLQQLHAGRRALQ